MEETNKDLTYKRFKLNGYIGVYDPNHHLANKSGIVYEHILNAEKLLGRPIKKGEIVHHKDENKSNNSLDNLMVFKTNSDHVRYHGGNAKLIKNDDGSYSTICINFRTKIENDIKNLCPICGSLKSYKSKVCINCWHKMESKNIPTKEILEELIYKYSFVKIGKMFNVTDNAVRRWCKKYDLPYKRDEIKKILQMSV